jgi:pimeloyl-ACP methyl ester carboxylesterase
LKKNKSPFLLKVVQWVFPRLERLAPFLAHRFFITIFFTPLNYRVPEKEKATGKQAKKFSLEVRGKKIQCYSWGEGPVILVVHGWAGRATQLRKIISAFVAARYSVVGFDGPAHGKSQGTSTDIEEFADVLKSLYARIGEPEAVIAHSFGGSAVLYAATRGLNVRKLINIASPTIGDEIIATYLRTINGSTGTALFFKSYIFRKTGKSFHEFTALHFITKLTKPVDLLLVHDDNDQEVPITHAFELMKVYPSAKLFITHDLGHTRILRDEKVIEKCLSFIKN